MAEEILSNEPLRILLIQNSDDDSIGELLNKSTLKITNLKTISLQSEDLNEIDIDKFDLILFSIGSHFSEYQQTFSKIQDQFSETPTIVLDEDPHLYKSELSISKGLQDYLPLGSITTEWLTQTIRNSIIRQSERNEVKRRYRSLSELSETVNYGMWITDGNYNRFVYTNDKFDEIFELSNDDLEHKLDEFLKHIHPDDKEATYSMAIDLMHGEEIDDEYRYVLPDDEIRWIWVKATAITDDEGNVKRIVGINADITERKQMEKNLHRTKQNFDQLAESVNDGFWLMSADRSDVIFINSAFEEIFGRSARELENHSCRFEDFVHEDDRQKFRKGIDTYGEAPDYQWDKPIRDVKVRIRQPDGEIRWVLHREFPVYDDDNTLVRIAGIVKDVTPYHEAREEKEKTRKRFEEVIRTIDDVVYLITPDFGETLFVSSSFKRIWGQSMEIIYDDPCNFKKFILEEDREKVLEEKREWINSPVEEPRVSEYRIKRSDGEIRWIHDEMYPVFEDGNLVRVAGTARDVTEQRELREQLEDSLERSQVLLKEVHHRVKNNLQIVLGLLGLQKRRVDNKHAQNALEKSQNRIHSMALIHQKLYQGSDLENIDFSEYVRELVNHIMESRKKLASDIEIELSVEDVSPGLDKVISCGLIINELVTNSIKHGFSSESSGTINISFERNEDMFELAISDDGKGVDNTDSMFGESSLGLRMVKNLSENQLNGTINTKSDNGLSVNISFPED